ncbi:MAG: helix-turn-helix transcriptional regulator, partial [Phycisphaerales bacterium]
MDRKSGIGVEEQAPAVAFPLLERCCDAATTISRIGARNRPAWLRRMCETVETISTEPIGVMALDVRVIGGQIGWQTLEAAFAGVPNQRLERRLYDDAWEGLASDDLAGPAGQRRLRPERFVGARRGMASDEIWDRSGYRAARERQGLHDFARAVLPFDGEDGPRLLVVQIDGFDPAWDPDAAVARCLRALSRHIVDAYRRVFVVPVRHRRDLLDRLTEAQREVAPFLATSMTETEIAEALNRSRHTIHDHAKSIYRAWGVNTRLT